MKALVLEKYNELVYKDVPNPALYLVRNKFIKKSTQFSG